MANLKERFRYYKEQGAARHKMAQIYYEKLLKASLLISIVPIVAITIMMLYGRLNIPEGLFSGVAVFFGSMFFAKPYLDDLTSLTYYVEQLALGGRPEAPPLSLLGSVDELSQSVRNLHHSWGRRTIELEAALAESSILFDTIPDILLMLDKDLNVVRANNAAIYTFRQTISEKNFTDLKPESYVLESIQQVLKSGKGAALEATLKTRGVLHDYLIMIERFPVQSVGGVAVVVIMHDMTDAKRRKQLLKDFVANASHEIRTPLTSVVGFIENLTAMEKEEEDNPKIRKKFLGIMSEQTERMSKLVDDLLSLSKAEMNEYTQPTDLVNIEEVLRSVQRRHKHMAEAKNMRIILKKEQELPDVVGDFSELIQVFTNLVSNAIKYGNADTTITIKTRVLTRFHPGENTPPDCKKLLEVSVIDKGEGIPEDELPRITERFYRVDKARSRSIGGTGLGLAITKHILARHHADMVIESELGKGSTFSVRLPVV